MKTTASAIALGVGLAFAMPALAADQGDAGEPDHEGVIDKFHSPPPGGKAPGHGSAGQTTMESTENAGEPRGGGVIEPTTRPAPGKAGQQEVIERDVDPEITDNNPTDNAGEPDGGGLIDQVEHPAPDAPTEQAEADPDEKNPVTSELPDEGVAK